MADLITWSPRVGSSGDDAYDPGPFRVDAGSTAGYSSTPTVDEVNAGSGINQIVAEIKRRRASPNSAFVSEGTRIVRSEIVYEPPTPNKAKMLVDADWVRTNEGWSAFSWSSYSPSWWSRQFILELRKALATDRYRIAAIDTNALVYSTSASKQYTSTVGGTSSYELGKENTGTRWRIYKNFEIPAYIPSCATCKIYFPFYRGAVVFPVRAYRANSYLGTIDGADWGNLDNLEGSVNSDVLAPSSSTWYDMCSITLSSAHAGGNYTYILTSGMEVDGDPTNHSGYISASHLPGTSTNRHILLELIP